MCDSRMTRWPHRRATWRIWYHSAALVPRVFAGFTAFACAVHHMIVDRTRPSGYWLRVGDARQMRSRVGVVLGEQNACLGLVGAIASQGVTKP